LLNVHSMIKGKAIVLAGGIFQSNSAKTTHGLVRGSSRFEVKAVIDNHLFGADAGYLLDQQHRNIPILPDVETALQSKLDFDYCIVGIAPKGGRLPEEMKADILMAIRNGKSIVSGLHYFLEEDKEIATAALESGASLFDIRKPRPRKDLNFWSGKVFEIECPKIAVLGTDCGLGKRTTAKILVEAIRATGRSSEMIFTGQTGWMQGWKYGFILDSTYNDFVSGELEYWMHECWLQERPDCIIVEGQSALRNPSGPCGAEFIISGNLDGIILQHSPARQFYNGFEKLELRIPHLREEIELVKQYKVPVIAVTLNTKGLSLEESIDFKRKYEAEFRIPVLLPLEEGVSSIVPVILEIRNQKNHANRSCRGF